MIRNNDIIYFDGAFVPLAEANLNVFSPAIICGPGPYETIRAFKSQDGSEINLFRADAHLRRLFETLRRSRYEHDLDVNDLMAVLCELIRRNDINGDANFRLHAFAADRGPGPSVATRTVISIGVEDRPLVRHGAVRARFSSWRRPLDTSLSAHAKLIGSPTFLRAAYMEAKAEGVDQIIIENEDGTLCEAGYGNLFLVLDGILVTPDDSSIILLGITRDTVLRLAEDLGLSAQARKVDRDELFAADEVFACGSGLDIMPIGEIAGELVGRDRTDEVTRKISDAYETTVRGNQPKRAEWLCRVDRAG